MDVEQRIQILAIVLTAIPGIGSLIWQFLKAVSAHKRKTIEIQKLAAETDKTQAEASAIWAKLSEEAGGTISGLLRTTNTLREENDLLRKELADVKAKLDVQTCRADALVKENADLQKQVSSLILYTSDQNSKLQRQDMRIYELATKVKQLECMVNQAPTDSK